MKITITREEYSNTPNTFNFGVFDEDGNQIALFTDNDGSLETADMSNQLTQKQRNEIVDIALNNDSGEFEISDKNEAAAALGSIKSEKKAKAARENGKKGGRPVVIK
jgi:hypothetical protein